jgi:phenylacetic acid degradation operon negative regulatory protein
MDAYRHIPLLDPQLPTDLLPSGWPRARVRDLFVAIYDGLAEQAELHVLAVVGQAAHRPSPSIRAHTVAGMSTA